MAGELPEKRKVLTLRERMFASELFAHALNNTQAYKAMMEKLGKPCTESTAASQGSRMRQKICHTAEFRAILESNGIDEITLAHDLNHLRSVQKVAFNPFNGSKVEYDDGPTQLGAAKIIGETLDALAPAIVNVSGTISIGEPPKPADLSEEGADA